MTQYNYTKSPCALDSLISQIQHSNIVIALSLPDTSLFGDQLTLGFQSDLSSGDKTTLDSVVAAHDGTPLPENKITEVVTQFEKRDKTLKLAHCEGSVTEDGTVTILLKIPGTPGTTDGRWISSGTAFFDTHTAGDKVLGVYFTDEDNILGGGEGSLVGSYTDLDADEINQGWAIPPMGVIKAEAIGGYGFAPAGFYLKVVAKKAGASPSGKFYCNFEWAKVE